MSPLFYSLAQGYTANQILQFLVGANPKLKKPISAAAAAGYTVDQIVNFLSDKEENNMAGKYMSSHQIEAKKKKEYEQKAISAIKGGAALGISALGAYALSRAIPPALQAAQAAAGGQLPGPPPPGGTPPQTPPAVPGRAQPAVGNQPPGTPPAGPAPIAPINAPQAQTPPIQPQGMAQPTQTGTTAPVNPIQPTIPSSQVLSQMSLKDKVDTMRKAGNTPEAIAAALNMQLTSGQRKWFGEQLKSGSVKPLQEIVKDYFNEVPLQTSEVPRSTAEVPLQTEEEVKPISKGITVASPKGIGQVKEIRGDQALIESDGKIHKANVDELIESPIPEKDLADLYDEMIAGIEKQTGKQVSRNVEWSGYDPKVNELAYKPHGSDKFYVYDDISPEDVNILTSFLTQRKSTGQNFIGAWEAGSESPIGAAMYQLIKKLQAERGGKGNEYKARFETIYDALEPAKTASKQRYAARKKEAKKPRPS